MRKLILLSLLSLAALSPLPSSAQDRVGDGNDIPLIYRGKQAVPFSSRYNGTPYWYSTAFAHGDVMFNGVLYKDILLNLNAERQELEVRWGVFAVVPDRDEISWFTMDGRRFVNLRYQGLDAKSGFYEVIYDGDATVLRHVEKAFRADVGDHNGKKIGYEDPYYDPEILEYFILLNPGGCLRTVR